MSKRIEWIDYAKGFTVLFVVLTHALGVIKYNMVSSYFRFTASNVIGLTILTFIMPVFFALSGFLYKNVSGIKEYIFLIYKKFIAFFIPYLFIGILLLLSYGKISLLLILKIIIVPTGHTWFLYSLFLIFIIFGTMDLLKLNIICKFILSMILFVMSKFISNGVLGVPGGMEGIKLTFVFIPYFLLGYILRNYISVEYFFSNRIKCIITISLTILSLFINIMVLHYTLLNSEFSRGMLISSCLLIIVLFKMFMIIKKNKLYNFIEYNGKNSIIIYLVHFLFVWPICKYMQAIMGVNDLTAIISIIVAFSISYTISLLVVFLCNYRALRWIFFPREFIDPAVKNTKLGKWMFP